ncbi:uncharacterized protein KGF55_004787 [Candida pseudojiufengensis]|uniref:uncharacterized protein n=1 Tax=Candida pseudojiufengensis TaxID=497109 RepID=UPI002225A924|nr:uncharacterized protein KGF55_004787 [Candida pseudojiufengensis]KAI5960064.1 hypothetical protein KGF55_004787 [Candida pseudojiufengensis]
MKVLALLSFVFFSFTLAQSLDLEYNIDAILKRANEPSQQTLEEVDQYLKQLVAAANGQPVNSTSKRDALILSKRDNVLLTAAFTALNNSGTGVPIVHTLVTDPGSQGASIQIIENYIKTTTLKTLLSAADNSNLAVDIVMRFFINYSLVPNLWTILVTLYNNGVLLKRSLFGDIIGGVLGGINQSIWSSLITLLNTIVNVEQICESLQKSGFAVSVVDDIISTSDGRDFAVKLFTAIIKDQIITISSLVDALSSTNFLQNTLTKILSNSTYRKIIFIWAVNFLVSMIKYIF